ncbi:MAG TPA: MFS transporter [Candidatus Limnocylindria bacterium]|nr:MFS transporter [Candidatus Limnocylindria bacterium]
MAIKLLKTKDYVPEKVYARRWWILGVLCLSLLVVMIGNTSLNVALPVLSRELNATNSQLQWMVDAYSLVFAGLLFTAGALGDRFGRKGILQIGLVLFGLASAYAAFAADSAGALVGARAVMGMAGAFIMPATLSILTNIFPPKERAKAVGIWAGVTGAGVALGPLLTGFVLEHFSWPAVFTINLPVIILTMLAVGLLVPRTADPKHTSLDPAGALLSIAGLSAVVYAIIEAPVHGWLSGSTLAIGAAGLAALAMFVWWELRVKHPMLDVRLFKLPAFGISALSLTLVFFALMGMFFNLAMLMQLVYGYSPLSSAVRMLPVAFTLMVAAPLSTPLAARFGKRRSVAAGMLIVAVGTALLSTVGVDSTYLHVVLGMVVMAFGMGVAMSPTTDLLMSAVPRERAGMGSAMNDTTRELGGALGIAVLGSLGASQYSARIAPAIAGLPEAAKSAAEQSLAGAMMVAQRMGTEGQPLLVAAKDAWMSGYHRAFLTGTVLIVAAAIIAYIGLPDKAADHIPEEGNFEV